jgi:hypothetical protein
MTIFNGPNATAGSVYFSRFLRVRGTIFVTEPDDTATHHVQLAEEHGIHEEIEILKRTNPDEVDGGMIMVCNMREREQIAVMDYSGKYEIPVSDRAREISGERFTVTCLNYEVILKNRHGERI